MNIHREGYKFIIYATLFWIGIGYLCYEFLPDNIVLLLTINLSVFLVWFWIIWFFRVPERSFTMNKKFVVAPADGKVVVIEETYESEYFKDQRLQISIFMSPMDVHINRCSIAGEIKFVRYHAGKHLVAWHPKSSTENERSSIVIGNDKVDIMVRQIAGAFARRICCYTKYGAQVFQNEEFGFIRFGSRVDVFLPIGSKVDVKIGDVVKGGVTVLASDVVDEHRKVEEQKVVVQMM